MDISEFRRLGLLQEVNRRLLHPLGLALEVTVGPDGAEWISGVWDCRDDPEGLCYGPGVIDARAAHRVGHELMARGGTRMARLGYVVQPPEYESPATEGQAGGGGD